MITFIAHIRVKPENAAAYEQLMAYVTAQTRAHEPGVVYYDWAKSVADPELYVVVEVYRDVARTRRIWRARGSPRCCRSRRR